MGSIRHAHIFFIILLIFTFVACSPSSRQRLAVMLDDVESYINERPDSALTVLEEVDSTALSTRALRARYSLLRVMALYKDYQDITKPGLLDPALSYYSRHGSADERLKAYYYQGCISKAKNDLNAAAIAFSSAEQYAEKAKDKHTVGLFYEAFASLYNKVFNTTKELEYVNKCLDVWEQSEDPMYGSGQGTLAQVYHTMKEWSKADSLYRKAIEQSDPYPHALSGYLSDYARMKLLQPVKDPEGAIDLLERKQKMTGGKLSPKEAGAYAYALALIGNITASESLRSRLDHLAGRDRYDALPWLARIAVFEGDPAAAYAYQVELHAGEEALIAETLTDPITQALQDYSEQTAQVEREKKLIQGIVALCIIVILLGMSFAAFVRVRKIHDERDRLITILRELEQDKQELEAKAVDASTEMASRLGRLRMQLLKERLARVHKIGEYGYWVWMEQNQRFSDKEVIRSLRRDFQEICKLEKDNTALVRRLDRELDGLVSQLKNDLGMGDHSREERLLCYWLIGLKADMIAELLDITTNNVYVKEHRLEKQIQKLAKPEYDFLIK